MNKQTISGIIYTTLMKRFSSSRIKTALNVAAKETINIIRERTQAGIDVDGKRLPALSPKYLAWKKKYVSGRLKGRKGGAPKLGHLGETTEWQATKTPAHIRLTGKTFSDMSYKLLRYAPVGQGSSSITYQIYILKRSARKIAWLADMKKARKFWGLSKNAIRREKEKARIAAAFAKALGTRSVGFTGKIK